MPVTSVARTIFDLASCVPPKRLARTFDNATSRNLTTRAEIHRVAGELMKRGRPGTKAMRGLLAARPIGERSTESGLEDRLLALLLDAGLSRPENQVDLGGDDGWIGRVDFYYRAERLIVEADSDRHHKQPEDVAADAQRDAKFRAAGFEVVRVEEEEIDRFPAVAVRKVREGLAEHRAA